MRRSWFLSLRKCWEHFFSMQNIDKENPIYLNVGHKTSEQQSAQILHTNQNREYWDNEHNWCMWIPCTGQHTQEVHLVFGDRGAFGWLEGGEVWLVVVTQPSRTWTTEETEKNISNNDCICFVWILSSNVKWDPIRSHLTTNDDCHWSIVSATYDQDS